MIDINRSIDYLAATGICPRRTHCILHTYRSIPYAAVLYVFRVERRVILRKFLGNDGIFESDFLENFIPLLYCLFYIRLPPLREIAVNIECYRLHRLNLLSPPVGQRIRRLKPPAVHIPDGNRRAGRVTIPYSLGKEIAYPRIGRARMIYFLWKK